MNTSSRIEVVVKTFYISQDFLLKPGKSSISSIPFGLLYIMYSTVMYVIWFFGSLKSISVYPHILQEPRTRCFIRSIVLVGTVYKVVLYK